MKIGDPFQLLFTTNFLSDAKRYHTFYATIQHIRKLYIALCDSASTNLDEVWGWKKVVKNLECVIGDPFQLLFTSNFIRRETLPYFVRNNTTYPQTLYSAMWICIYVPTSMRSEAEKKLSRTWNASFFEVEFYEMVNRLWVLEGQTPSKIQA